MKLKLFISYSHADESYIERFIKVISPLEDNGILEYWYDRNLTAGDEFWAEIDNHLADRDIVCLFLSQDYLASTSCKEEMRRAILMKKEHGVLIIPIVLRPCQWLDFNELSSKLAATKDGKPISKYGDEDDAWMEVYGMVKDSVTKYKKLRESSFSSDYKRFLDDATILKKAHSMKNELKLSDIFIYPDLTIIDNKDNDKKISSENVVDDFEPGNKIAIIGDDQSGKTALLKVYIKVLKERGFLPVYIKDPQELLQGNIDYRIDSMVKEQYIDNNGVKDFDHKIIVPIIDDFHKTKDKEKIIQRLQAYESCIVVVDDIFSLDLSLDMLIADFAKYKIRELKPSLRNKLIKKWILIKESDNHDTNFLNEDLEKIDEYTRIVDSSLGKMTGFGIMPAYPFFILNFLSFYEDGERPLDQKITSQGFCYQALIYLFLRKQGVSNDQIDTYLNFLTEFAFRIYDNKGEALSKDDFDNYLIWYEGEFNLTEKKDKLISNLCKSSIIGFSSMNNVSFAYPYLYYFFAGRYFAQQWDELKGKNIEKVKREVGVIIDNLHKSENAYIIIFMAHHTKASSLIDEIMKRVDDLFNSYTPATLDEDCLSVFAKQHIKAATPILPKGYSPEQNRQKELVREDELEEQQRKKERELEEQSDEFSQELRRGIKTVEVVGTIIKNRAGSFNQEQLCNMFEGAMDIHLRQLTAFLELVGEMIKKEDYADFLIERVRLKFPNLSEDKLRMMAHNMFWGGNFGVIIGFMMKLSSSLGAKQLIQITKKVCDERNTPATFMLKHTILMWITKNIQIDDLKRLDRILKSPISKAAMLWIICDYCQMHRIDHKDVQKLIALGIKHEKLLPAPYKK